MEETGLLRKGTLKRFEVPIVISAIFLFFLFYFYVIHPLVLFDMDDWLYSYLQRNATLQWKAWNPARVLPEVLMPLVTLVGGKFFEYLTLDHFAAISLSYAITLSLFISVMIYFLYGLIKNTSARLSLLMYFLICHFWIYRTTETGNNYMFKTVNSTCVFFYVIPNILNCIIVLWLMQIQTSGKNITKGFFELSDSKKGTFVFLVFFAIYSNIWASILLAVYVSVAALFDATRMLAKKQFSLIVYLKTHIVEIVIVFLWAIQQIFEMNGGRASVTEINSYSSNLVNAIRICFDLLRAMNRYFLLGAVGIVICGLMVMLVNKDKKAGYRFLILFLNFIIVALYLVLSCARTGTGYLGRADVQYCLFFLGMLVLILCADELLQKYSITKMVCPLLLAIAICNCNTSGKTYGESIAGNYSPEACMRFSNDVMQQFLDAEAEGKRQIILTIPDFHSTSWPIAGYTGDRFSSHFYKLGVTENYIEVTDICYTEEKNEKLHIAEELLGITEG